VPGDVKEVVANRGLVRVRLPRTCRGGGGAGGTLVLVVAVVPLLPTGVWALERVGSRERTWADRVREWPLGRVGVLWLVPPAFAFASIALQRRMLLARVWSSPTGDAARLGRAPHGAVGHSRCAAATRARADFLGLGKRASGAKGSNRRVCSGPPGARGVVGRGSRPLAASVGSDSPSNA
jgi:hypothetical protein